MGSKREKFTKLIIKTAIDEFANNDNATIKTIAEKAGLPKANIHYYFKSKEDLYKAALNASVGMSGENELRFCLKDAVKERDYLVVEEIAKDLIAGYYCKADQDAG